jgi:hypothetical protein
MVNWKDALSAISALQITETRPVLTPAPPQLSSTPKVGTNLPLKLRLSRFGESAQRMCLEWQGFAAD